MQTKKLNRRDFLRLSAMTMAGAALAGCCPSPTPPEPEKIVETKIVEVEGGERVITVVPTPEEAEGGDMEETATYERTETLYTTGSAWSPPSDWNPVTNWNYATGVIGLLFETLFLYNPITDEMIPWLAESGEWTADDVYQLKIREGITWSDGEPLTAADVKFTYELGSQFAGVPYSSMWNYLASIDMVDDYTLDFTFSEPLYHRWENSLYGIAIVPMHLWEGMSEEEVTAGANENPVGSGAYLYDTHGQDRMVWLRNDDWWATKLLGLTPAPKRVVDLVNRSNNVSLGMLLQGDIDLSNNFLPGIKDLVMGGYGIVTYFPDSPYMLSANTACLFLNLTKSPMDDPEFRKAVAFSIDTSQIVNVVYGGIVEASDPVGLLPNEGWSKYKDDALVEQYGFSYDPDQAKQILANAGYVDVDGDGFVEAPDGSPIELKVIVPFGWTDWMESINVISRSAQAAGINLEVDFPDFGGYQDQLYGGTFDMAINNFGSGASNTVWTYYNWLFLTPIQEQMTNGNFGRYDNQAVFDLVEQLDKTPPSDDAAMQTVMSAIQEIQLQEMPVIPLWYNGMWFQGNTSVWTNFPSSEEGAPKHWPCVWGGYWQLGGLLTLTELELTPTE
jgi:peptide/nickel transport system substrate-binding protein